MVIISLPLTGSKTLAKMRLTFGCAERIQFAPPSGQHWDAKSTAAVSTQCHALCILQTQEQLIDGSVDGLFQD